MISVVVIPSSTKLPTKHATLLALPECYPLLPLWHNMLFQLSMHIYCMRPVHLIASNKSDVINYKLGTPLKYQFFEVEEEFLSFV